MIHELRAPFRDGTTHFVFDPLVFIERLAALVPPPRMHQLTYHGVLAPGSSWRSELVPSTARERRRSCGAAGGRVQPCHRYSWAELMKRVFGQDVLTCPRCGSRRRWIAAITAAAVRWGEKEQREDRLLGVRRLRGGVDVKVDWIAYPLNGLFAARLMV